jgi:hypothetical protein
MMLSSYLAALLSSFFDDVFWKESDLGVYIHSGGGVSACGQYFLREEGYRFVEESIEQEHMQKVTLSRHGCSSQVQVC